MSLVFGQPNGTVGPGAGAVEVKTIASPTVQSTGALTITFATPLKDAFVHFISPLVQSSVTGVYVAEHTLVPPITISGNTVTVNIMTSGNVPVAPGTLTGVYVQVVAIH